MFEGKVVVVTGGTRGIGFATVRKFLQNKAKVVLFGSRSETVEEAMNKLRVENASYEVMGLYPDISDLKAVEEAMKKVVEEYGRIDVLINNAGISARESIYDYTEENFDKIIDLNIKGVFNCSRAVVSYMKEQGGGVILNTSSMVSIYGQAAGCGYPTSKFAVNGMTKSLARELAPFGIRVNAVAPGIIETDMVRRLPKEMIEPLIQTIPLGRIGKPEDIANAFVFLASDMASYITGVVLSVDGLART